MNGLFAQPVSSLLAVMGLGYLLGRVRIRTISLGPSAILFVALLLGAFGFTVPKIIGDLGVVLFVYAVGLQAGPRFFHTFRRRGIPFALIALAVGAAGAAVAVLATLLCRVPAPLAVGMFTGALTSTPGLAAALNATGDPSVSVGYGIAYPFGVVAVVLFVQVLPKILGASLAEEERAEEAEAGVRVARRQFVVRNPNFTGRPLKELRLHEMAAANLTRLRRGSDILPVTAETCFMTGDVVSAVGGEADLDRLRLILGEETEDPDLMRSGAVDARNVLLSSAEIVGRPLSELRLVDRFGIILTRVRRDAMEFIPTARFVLEIGDSVRAVGEPSACEAFARFAGQQEKRIHETNMTALAVGMAAGVVAGMVPIGLPGGVTLRLGLAGGPLIVGLLLSHYGRVGSFNVRTPHAAKYILRELGLAFFLAWAGAGAGGSAAPVLREHGLALVLLGAAATALPMLAGLLLARRLFSLDILTTLGVICGSMTSTPALGAVSASTTSERPAVAYAAAYPVALIAVTVFAQLLALIL
ncbi:MAG: TrkA C-terminal domain-containing protein [bacterium]|nr:TrkA C-terminal domain-containing protein [bacterium]